jgi:hypothetical protein
LIRMRPADDARGSGHVNRTYCSEVLSLVPGFGAQSRSVDRADAAPGRPLAQVKVVLIDIRVDGFFLERFTDLGKLVGETRHDTLDEAMWQAYSEYVLSDWRFCPDDVDPLEFIRTRSGA